MGINLHLVSASASSDVEVSSLRSLEETREIRV
jgi:hypothetical protein